LVERAWTSLIRTVRQRLLDVPSAVAGGDAALCERIRKAIAIACEQLSKTEAEKIYGTEITKSDIENDAE
jgi:hypothetical protein